MTTDRSRTIKRGLGVLAVVLVIAVVLVAFAVYGMIYYVRHAGLN